MKFFQLLSVIAENYDFSPFYKTPQEIKSAVDNFYKANGLSKSLKIKNLSVMEEWIDFEVGLIPMRVEIECGKELKIKLA